MHTFYLLFIIFCMVTGVGGIEFYLHQRRLNSIPIRIHVNGTRGKSSVTRLIGAGLRAGGISTITKVTGTLPRLILNDGREVEIYRRAGANIIEQLSIVRFAVADRAEALVIECMALQPEYQRISETQMIQAHTGVITNIRMDHLDVMGPALSDVTRALAKTIPYEGHLFSAETQVRGEIEAFASDKSALSHFITREEVTSEEMELFSYIEHRENVALALAVCKHHGVSRSTALEGMYSAIPDEGSLKCAQVNSFGKTILFYNAFAANDPESTQIIWQRLVEETGLNGRRIVLLNTRQDRLDRTRQLAEMIARSLSEEMDYLFLIGDSTDVVTSMVVRCGLESKKIVPLPCIEPNGIFEKILSFTSDISSVFAIGNMGGIGHEVASYFETRSIVRNG